MATRVRDTLSVLRGRRAVAVWLYAVALAASVVIGSHVVFSGVIDGGLDLNYITPMSWLDLVLALAATPALAVLVALLTRLVERATPRTSGGMEEPSRRRTLVLWLVLAAIMLAAWAPYLLTYAPGSVMTDSLYSIAGDRTNHHPILFTAIMHSFARAGEASGDINRGILAYTTLQSVILALSLAGMLVFALRRGAPKWWAAAGVAYFALVPVFPIYAINVQKDPLFSLFVATLAIVLFKVVESDGAWLRSARGIGVVIVTCLAVLFFRNNGILVVLGSVAALALVYRRGYVRFYAAVAALLVLTFLIQGPGYDALQIRRNTFVESIGIMLQQVGYAVASGGDVTPEQQQFLSGMLPYEEWQRAYAPCLVDTLKWNLAFDGQYLNANRPAFLRTWAELLRQNPAAYGKAYALGTLGFWKIGASNQYGFADTKIVPNELGVEPTDLFVRLTGTSIKPQLDATRGKDGTGGYVGSGVLIWLTLLSAVILIARGKGRYAVALAPFVFLWLSVMIAAPVAFSLRYVFALALGMPGVLLLPFVQPRTSA